MPVFTDANHRDVDRVCFDQFSQSLTLLTWIRFTVDQVCCLQWPDLGQKALPQVLPETCRVSHGQPDILIEMKHHDFVPFNRLRGETSQHLELAGACCKDQVTRAFG